MDRRVARTRTVLHEALLKLIGERDYETITVEDICARANVGRSTFYAHYTSKDDLLRSGLRQMRESLLDRRADATISKFDGLAFSPTIFRHARDHIHLHRALVPTRGGAIALDTIRQTLCDLVRAELETGTNGTTEEAVPREFVVQYLVGAYMAVMTWWLDGGAELAPERIDAMFQRLASRGLASRR